MADIFIIDSFNGGAPNIPTAALKPTTAGYGFQTITHDGSTSTMVVNADAGTLSTIAGSYTRLATGVSFPYAPSGEAVALTHFDVNGDNFGIATGFPDENIEVDVTADAPASGEIGIGFYVDSNNWLTATIEDQSYLRVKQRVGGVNVSAAKVGISYSAEHVFRVQRIGVAVRLYYGDMDNAAAMATPSQRGGELAIYPGDAEFTTVTRKKL